VSVDSRSTMGPYIGTVYVIAHAFAIRSFSVRKQSLL
jgi:hypothetical protein